MVRKQTDLAHLDWVLLNQNQGDCISQSEYKKVSQSGWGKQELTGCLVEGFQPVIRISSLYTILQSESQFILEKSWQSHPDEVTLLRSKLSFIYLFIYFITDSLLHVFLGLVHCVKYVKATHTELRNIILKHLYVVNGCGKNKSFYL